MPVFSIPLSGLSASSSALSSIANNLANLNTVGYKQTRTTFRDMFYQNVGSNGSGNPIQIGAGAAVGSVSTIFSGSNIETSGVPTDVAISGEGFFVVERDGVTRYTRAGNFTTSPDGTLSTENGEYVMGYPAPNGIIDPSQGLIPLQMGARA
jgi:flagellar hook protein FlgE